MACFFQKQPACPDSSLLQVNLPAQAQELVLAAREFQKLISPLSVKVRRNADESALAFEEEATISVWNWEERPFLSVHRRASTCKCTHCVYLPECTDLLNISFSTTVSTRPSSAKKRSKMHSANKTSIVSHVQQGDCQGSLSIADPRNGPGISTRRTRKNRTVFHASCL